MDVDVASITMDDAACRSTTTTGATTGDMTGVIGHIGVSPAYQWTSDRTSDLISAIDLDRIPVGTVNVKPCRRARARRRLVAIGAPEIFLPAGATNLGLTK